MYGLKAEELPSRATEKNVPAKDIVRDDKSKGTTPKIYTIKIEDLAKYIL